MKFLVLTLASPLVSFGDVKIDHFGTTGRFPGLSMITGLLGNAMGYYREDADKLNDLQENIIFGARIDFEGKLMQDFQTAKLAKNDKAWTRFGVESRGGGNTTYDSPHIKYVPYLADHLVTVALTVRNDIITDIEAALREPKRPLFIGRKSNIPTRPIIGNKDKSYVDASTLREALLKIPSGSGKKSFSARWPDEENGGRRVKVMDVKDWGAGTHLAFRYIREGILE